MVVPTRPLLAAWKASTLYLYEFVSGVGFKLLNSTALASAALPPEMQFLKDQVTLATLRKDDSLILNTRSFVLSNVYFTLIKNIQVCKMNVSKVSDFILMHKGQSDITTNGVIIDSDGDLVSTINSAGLQVPAMKSATLHPNDEYYLACDAYNNSYILPKVADYDGRPLFNAYDVAWTGVGTKLNDRVRQVIAGLTSGNITACVWSNDGKYAYLVCTDGNIYTYEVANETSTTFEFNKLYATPFSNTPVTIRVRPDDKHVAISVINGSSQYITYIYKRVGYILTLQQTITDFGRQFDWSADGSMLVDATSKRLFIYDPVEETYEENFTYMTDVVADLTVQCMNNFSMNEIPQAYVFNVGKSLLADRSGIDLANLKLMLLDADATFDATETTILDISAANEVSSSDWPVGGKTLANVSYSTVNGKAALIADDLISEVINSLTFKSAVLYDATSGNPLIWYPSVNKTTEKDTKIVFEFSSGIVIIDS